MKYIVFWVFLKLTPVPCPQQAEYDKIYGKGFNCLVAHCKVENVKDSAWYWSRASAYREYAELITTREKYCVMTYIIGGDSEKLPYPSYFMAPYSDIRIDSIPNKLKP